MFVVGSIVLAALTYCADVVMVSKGVTTHSHVCSDGVRTRSEVVDEKGQKSGSFIDDGKKLFWVYGPSFGCVQVPAPAASPREELVGSETIDGHPTKQFKVTQLNTVTKKDAVQLEWRATDLGGLVIQRKFEEGQSKLENIVVGKPDEKMLAFPSPPCKYEAPLDTTRDAPQAAGGARTIRFSDASCKQLVPLPLTMSIPSDYAIRKGGHMGCFWGAEADLARLLATNDQADFDSIKRGVFWCRVSEGTEYDPIHRHFISDLGPDDQWSKSMPRAAGAKNVVVTPKTVGGIATLRVTASVQGKRVYMLYLGVGDSPAILINYHPAGRGDAADDAIWQHFLDSVQVEK